MTSTPRWKLPVHKANQAPAPFAYRMLIRVMRPLIGLFTRRTWRGGEHIPQHGKALVVTNHLSNYDTIGVGEYLIYHGRWPRYMGKSELWKIPVVSWFSRQCRQIPVKRNTPQAKDSLIHAAAALNDGDLVALYPEGTITRDPDGWPMTARPGAARLALQTGAPVIPVACWGTDAMLGRVHMRLPKIKGKNPVTIVAGEPIDLSQFALSDDPPKEDLRRVTDLILARLTEMVAEIRGEQPPADRWDMRVGRRVPISED